MNRSNQAAGNQDEAELELIKDLERQSIDEIRKLRAHQRLDVRAQLQIRPGNASQWNIPAVIATTNDVSAGGCAAIAPIPLAVGDIYRIEFERDKVDAPVVFARCVRCRLLREDAFEVAMAFFNPISMGQTKPAATKDLLD